MVMANALVAVRFGVRYLDGKLAVPPDVGVPPIIPNTPSVSHPVMTRCYRP
jgi:hypothetical protein